MKLFSFNLHIAVISDITNILKDLYGDKVEIIDWNISDQYWLFYKDRKDVKHINQQTWKNIDQDMINRFVNEYQDYLSQFDGFIVTHTPVFSLLYESFNKPIFMINSCRYEQPFSFKENNDIRKWYNLNIKLKQMHEKGQLIVISNNKADQEYLRIGTGIESMYIPSLCLYTNAKYNPHTDKYIVYSDSPFLRKTEAMIPRYYFSGHHYTWEQLYTCRGIIHMPYEISTMSIFEQYSANIPLFFPSKNFIKQLVATGNYFLCSRYIKFDSHLKLQKVFPKNLEPAMNDVSWINWWIDKSDFYRDDCDMQHIIYFNSMDELDYLLNTIDTRVISERMRQHNIIRKNKVYNSWKEIMDKYIYI